MTKQVNATGQLSGGKLSWVLVVGLVSFGCGVLPAPVSPTESWRYGANRGTGALAVDGDISCGGSLCRTSSR